MHAGEKPGGLTTPIPGSGYRFGIYTQVTVNKFADHSPQYRGEGIFTRAGMMIPATTSQRQRATGREGIFARAGMMIPATPGSGCWSWQDAYGVQDGVYLGSQERILAACCKAHARRKFVEAKPNDSIAAAQALSYYRGLYDIEDRARYLSFADRLALSQQESVPIMNDLHSWLLARNADPMVLPKSSLGKAVRYALNQWDELSVFLSDGAIPMDNNVTEGELQRLTIGRKNWLFVGSSRGGQTAATLYRLVSSAARHHLDVWAYMAATEEPICR